MLEKEIEAFKKWQKDEDFSSKLGNIPLIIGENVKPCPRCGKPLSYARNYYFCRNCPFKTFW